MLTPLSLHVARVKIGRDDVYTYKGPETAVQTLHLSSYATADVIGFTFSLPND